MEIKLKQKKVIEKFKEIKEIEDIKCNTKMIAFLVLKYDEFILISNELNKKKPL